MTASLPSDATLKLPSPPFVNVDGIYNFRDIGGYATAKHSDASPSSVRRGLIFRSGDPTTVTAAGKETIRETLGIKAIFDLRSRPEIARYGKTRGPLYEVNGVERIYTPVFEQKDVSPEAMSWGYKNYLEGGPSGFRKAYAEILDSFPPNLGTILQHLLDKPDAPILVHCSAGKDRTGVLCALLLSIAGVSDATISAEYQLTEQGMQLLKPIVLGVLLKDERLSRDPEGVERMVSARRENMLAVLQMVREEYGGFENYIKRECGFSDEDVQQLRTLLTSSEPPVL